MDSYLAIRDYPIETDSAESESLVREFSYSPGLDAVRGIAVLAVMFYHCGIFFNGYTPLVIGGFLGVDIFFVLSGFLITSVLIREKSRNGGISLRNFYLRRIYRLVPAYWLFLFILVLLGWVLLPDAQVTELYSGNKFLYAVTYLTNWVSAYGAAGGNLNHTWSLSIEEQFYLFWPVALVIAFWGRLGSKQLIIFTILLVGFLGVLRLIRLDSGTPTSVLYYSTESRIDSLLIGCIASLVFMYRVFSDKFLRSSGFSILAILATCGIVWILSWLDERNPDAYRIYLPTFAICTAIAILWLVSHQGESFSWFFGNRLLLWVGKISYGLYLWHYLSFEITRQLFTSTYIQMAAGILLAFGTAAGSFYFLEQRFLAAKKRLEVA